MTEMLKSSYKTLEYEKVIEKLSEHTVSKLGREKIRKIKPSSKKDVIIEKLEETEDVALLIRLSGGIPQLNLKIFVLILREFACKGC